MASESQELSSAHVLGDDPGGFPSEPRKRRRLSERARATRACDRCKKRKIKCNGTQPCEVCRRASAQCSFDSPYTRGRAPEIARGIPAAAIETESRRRPGGFPLRGWEGNGGQAQRDFIRPSDLDSQDPDSGSEDEDEDDEVSSQVANGAGAAGNYIGPTSGVSFLLRVQKRLHQSISISRAASTIFTFGDAPLSISEQNRGFSDPAFCMMLPRADAQRLVDRYFDFAMPTYRFLHRPTVQAWFDEWYDTLGVMRSDSSDREARVALLLMVCAHGRVYMPEKAESGDDNGNVPGPEDLSTRYFLAAEHQLTRERGAIRLASVQARLTQCYYLLTQSRINHCYSLFGTVAHLAFALGLNRNSHSYSYRSASKVDIEYRRRTFWCSYMLDAFLSVALGRPRSFHDEDIDTELPACADDDEMDNGSNGHRAGPSVMLASVAHIKLARITAKIVRDLYSIKPISSGRRAVLTERISRDLSDWRVEMGRCFLDVERVGMPPLFQRQSNVLSLAYWHAIILTHRPIVLAHFTRFLQQQPRNSERERGERGVDGADGESLSESAAEAGESVRQVLAAALDTVRSLESMTRNGQLFRVYWITIYYAFTATIMLYLHVIQQRASPPEAYTKYFSAANRCQSALLAVAEKGSLSERYCLVLEELRVEALRQTQPNRRMQPTILTQNTASVTNSTAGQGGVASLSEPAWSDLSRQQPQLNVGFPPPELPGGLGVMSMDESPNGSDPLSASVAGFMGETLIDFNGMPSSAFPNGYDGYGSGWGQFVSILSSGMGNFDMFFADDAVGF